MTNKHWRELVEIVGVIGIVASMILVASELRQSNDIAAAQTQQQISEVFNVLNSARATDPDFAKLFPKLESPESHLITATEASQIRGIAWHFINIIGSVQSAYESGLISREVRDGYIVDFAYTMEQWPGIRSHYVDIYQNLELIQGVAEYKPIADYIAAQAAAATPD